MRPLTVADLKGKKCRGPRRADAPREGTALRAAYDALMAGECIPLVIGYRNQLCDFYGLDLETAVPWERVINAAGRQVAITPNLWRMR